MIEWIVILLIIFCILVWHYSQSTHKYSISQLKESQISTNLISLWEEKNPVVISDVRALEIWSSNSLKQTRFWGAQPIWNEYETHPMDTPTVTRGLQTTWSDILGKETLILNEKKTNKRREITIGITLRESIESAYFGTKQRISSNDFSEWKCLPTLGGKYKTKKYKTKKK